MHQEIKNMINKLTDKQLFVFECIAMNIVDCHPRQILESLLKKELIELHIQQIGNSPIKHYLVPIPIHMAYCEWCSEKLRMDIRNSLGREVYDKDYDCILNTIGLTHEQLEDFIQNDLIEERKYEELEKFYINHIIGDK